MRAEAGTPVEQPSEEAVFVGPAERPVFVWHHPPALERTRRAGIVLCPPLGYEYMSSYRTYRILARRLSALGFDVIRVDYDGTGNSCGDAEDAGRMAAWLRSIRHAIAEARRCAGSDTLFLLGLRGGSLLALQAALDDGQVAGLVLWHPYSSGRAYVRELKALARLTDPNEPDGNRDEAGIRVDGYVFTRDVVDALSAWTIDDAVDKRPAPDVLLIGRDDCPADAATDAYLRTLGTSVTRVQDEGLADMLLPPHLSKVPIAMVDAIAGWFSARTEQYPSESGSGPDARADNPRASGSPGRRGGAPSPLWTRRTAVWNARAAAEGRPRRGGGHPVQHGRGASRRTAPAVRAARARLGIAWTRCTPFRSGRNRRQHPPTRKRNSLQRDRAHGARCERGDCVHQARGAWEKGDCRWPLLGRVAGVSVCEAWPAGRRIRLNQRAALSA